MRYTLEGRLNFCIEKCKQYEDYNNLYKGLLFDKYQEEACNLAWVIDDMVNNYITKRK